MKNTNTRKILLGLSLLGATTLAGLVTPAQAAPRDVRAARKDLKEARKDVRRANNGEDRRDARTEVRDAHHNLRKERRENRVLPGHLPLGYQNIHVLEGAVLNNLAGRDFTIRANSGRVVRVMAVNGKSGRISRGDRVRVSGTYSGASFRANSVSILINR